MKRSEVLKSLPKIIDSYIKLDQEIIVLENQIATEATPADKVRLAGHKNSKLNELLVYDKLFKDIYELLISDRESYERLTKYKASRRII